MKIIWVPIVCWLSACGYSDNQEPLVLPAVNEENCTPESISQQEPRLQQELSAACLRSSTFSPSEKREY